MVFVFILLVGCLAIQYVFTDVPWLRTDSDSSNTIKLFTTHYEIQYWIAGFVNKGMSLYGIMKGTITNSGYGQAYGAQSYSSATLL